MDAKALTPREKALTPRDLFDGKVHYEVPPFQRPYVWNEEDQWQPLWDDIVRVTENLLGSDGLEEPGWEAGHFLGAVVLKQLPSTAGDPSRWSVIDGQQRLTTLQLFLDAAQLVVAGHGTEDDAETIHELVVNGSSRFAGTPKRFKLWPSRVDRVAYEQAMDDALGVSEDLRDSRIVGAHAFFQNAVSEWVAEAAEEERADRLAMLAEVLERRLQLVAIDLSHGDDDQLIFETLNDRGTPLLAADLIKNYVFQKCEPLGVDVDAWSEKYWQDFDEDWWRAQVAQGRLYRSRIDLFLQYWLTMRLREEIPTDAVFGRFRKHADAHFETPADAEDFIIALRSDADTFRRFADMTSETPTGRFYERVVEAFELGAFIPLLLSIVSDNHDVPPDQVQKALEAVESWTVRRTLLRRTMKNVNKLVVAILKELDTAVAEQSGDRVVSYLAAQTADAQQWPTDAEVTTELPKLKQYGNVKQSRLRTVLGAVELHRRTQRHEAVTLPSRLEIEHVMPKGWRTHWGEGVVHDPEASARRDRLVHSIGNLTLVTKKLNGTLSNRPWRDADAAEVASTGPDAGLGKRSLVGRYSILLLNKDIVDNHQDQWTEEDIRQRSASIASDITEIWPRPA